MECLTYKSEIESTFSNVRTFSFNEKKSPLFDHEKINAFLDTILDLKNHLKVRIDKIHFIIELIEKITWFNGFDDECYMLINDLISSAKDLHSTLIRQYITLNLFRQKGIAKEEIKNFKNSIDELKECYQDLESVFFFLPNMPEFKDTTNQLSLI
jgi:hypothetical protein